MTKMRRRTFVAGTIGAVAAGPSLAASCQGDLAGRKLDDFAGQIGSRISLRDSQGKTSTVTLVEVHEGKRPAPAFRQPISLLFQHSADTPLEQDVYEVSHSVLGQSKLLAVPSDHRCRFMEIVLA